MTSVWGKKLNAHGRENNKVWWVEIDFKQKTNIRPKAKCLPRSRIFREASGVYPSFPFSSAQKELFYYFFCFIKNLSEKQILYTWSRWRSRVSHSRKCRVSTQVFLFFCRLNSYFKHFNDFFWVWFKCLRSFNCYNSCVSKINKVLYLS